ncbi:Hypothetical protein SMAX5B_012825 [Scophthalmus maximus]|uniref:Uncharacterized protein n=1 Tax=Scophthalmus maximus TaxID=52904 RepID=A0A2U9BYF8_SCOMX|nr:Hypothetical protein SMAX5B_012825 [Scophthalmus maximus]
MKPLLRLVVSVWTLLVCSALPEASVQRVKILHIHRSHRLHEECKSRRQTEVSGGL